MENKTAGSTPSFTTFDPVIPYQREVLTDVAFNYDYGLGTHELMFSGSVGSAKSILLAHMVIKHCIEYPRARVGVFRRSRPDLRDTIWQKILEHMEGSFIEKKHYNKNLSLMKIRFRNKSEIITKSWADGNYLKLRSLELSAAVIEELTENDDDDEQAYLEIFMRVGRLPHIKENWIAAATNPGSPAHWAYKRFIESKESTRHVYYSVTTDNPFLPPQYVESLKKNMPAKMVRRMIYGEWIEISGEVVYFEYDKTTMFRRETYTVDPYYPVILTWDFNIGEGKPMSMAVMQYINDTFHIFDEVVVEGARTADTIDELDGKGLLRPGWKYHVCGDAAGKHKDTRQGRSDYDIIKSELGKRNIKFEFHVPLSNPSVRNRHNKVNAYCKNGLGENRLFVYESAPTADQGFRLTKLKKGAGYVEDDSKPYQHITTAIGYAIMFETLIAARKPQGTVQL